MFWRGRLVPELVGDVAYRVFQEIDTVMVLDTRTTKVLTAEYSQRKKERGLAVERIMRPQCNGEKERKTEADRQTEDNRQTDRVLAA